MSRNPGLLPVRIIGDNVLRIKAEEVKEITPEIIDFIGDLTHTMYQRDGIGMAAPQAGRSLRVFVIDTDWSKDDKVPNPRVMINPEILEASGETENEEGCLSLPGIYAKVTRPSRIRYSFTDLEGNHHEETAEGWEAVVIQHEYDHLYGILFTDKLRMLTRLTLRSRLKELESMAVNGENIRQDIHNPDLEAEDNDD
ncbi:MAG: peptide deformylase [Candidatus Cloacimonetes bacterium]|nr:peptide deformylase [Candidatus Cloacimonadota bacterium]